jgi:hypothetical protein
MKYVILHERNWADGHRFKRLQPLTWITSRKVGSLGFWPRRLKVCDRGAV